MIKATSRLVARGFKQREGVDFSETFASTVSSSCVRLLSANACECDLDLCHFDLDQGFVQSGLEEDVFPRLPKGYGDLSGKVVRLNKSLYGLKQASRIWHAHLTTCLKIPGFEQCMTDVCVFRLIEDGGVAITAVVHVDDVFAVEQKERCDRLCVDLNQTSDLKWYGGCRYSRDRKRGNLTISQQSFAEELVKKFLVTSVQSVPLKVGVQLEEFSAEDGPQGPYVLFPKFGYNHGRDCYRFLDAETGRVAYSRDVTWHHRETPWITPIRAAPIEPPRAIYVPMPQSVPVAAPFPAPVATPPAPASAATLPSLSTRTSNSPAPIPPRISRELEHEG